MLVRSPHRSVATVEQTMFRLSIDLTKPCTSSHIRYSDAAISDEDSAGESAGCTASSLGGNPKISQPCPASTDRNPSTSRTNARSASASPLKRRTCAPVIMVGLLYQTLPGSVTCYDRRTSGRSREQKPARSIQRRRDRDHHHYYGARTSAAGRNR